MSALPPASSVFHRTRHGNIIHGDSLAILAREIAPRSVDLIMTSPPYALARKKHDGNPGPDDYVAWFKDFGLAFKRVLKESGSLVIDIGGAWIPGQPTRSLYHFKLLIMLCEEVGLHLAQEFYWWNPSKLPSPAEWVTVRRIRVKDAVNTVWWLSPTPYPRASNRRVLQPYSRSMRALLRQGYRVMTRPSGHEISANFARDNGAAIPPNLIAIANTESNGSYQRYCREHGIAPHPARFPSALPEYFIRMLTDPGDLVVDPFAGSCVTGEVSERLGRRWICGERSLEYLQGARGRFDGVAAPAPPTDPQDDANFYKQPRAGLLWTDDPQATLDPDGGRSRL